MTTCTNISAKAWLEVTTAKAVRHGRTTQVCVFGLGSSMYRGLTTGINPDGPMVGR